MNLVTLRTYGEEGKEIEFTIFKNYLKKSIDIDITMFLNTYTFDQSLPIYNKAKSENKIINEKIL